MEQGVQQVKWVCIGVAGVACIVAYHKWYTRQMLRIFDRQMIMPHYQILEQHGLDYGSSLADNYFHGYLELILPPHLGSSPDGGFAGRVDNYKREQQLLKEVFPNKLFVIVHKTGFSPDTYENKEHPRFWSRKKMVFEVEGRNGIRKRSYQTSVYKVMSADQKEQITVVMEGAPCLRQLYEAAKNSEALRKMSDTIISTFMAKIREKIDSNAYCKGLCELIFVDDSPGSETTGRGGLDWLANKLFESVLLDKSRYFP